MTYDLISSKQVIAKVYADLALPEGQHPVADFAGWASEAIEKIGATGALADNVVVLKVDRYKAKLPADFKQLNQAAYSITSNGPWYIMQKFSGSFFSYKCQCGSEDSGHVDIYSAMANQPFREMTELARQLIAVEKNANHFDYVIEFDTRLDFVKYAVDDATVAGVIALVKADESDDNYPNLYITTSTGIGYARIGRYTEREYSGRTKLTYGEAAKLVNSDPYIRDTIKSLAQHRRDATIDKVLSYDLNRRDGTTPQFVINNGYIQCSHKHGYVALSYKTIPLDDEGYPMLPDHISAIEACYWYITMKYYYPKWVTGQIRDAVYYHSQNSWNYHCKNAYGCALMPDQTEMINIKNTWLRMLPIVNEDMSGFQDLNKQEHIGSSRR